MLNNCSFEKFKHFHILWILALGNLIRGVANSFFYTEFEAWLIQEYKEVNLILVKNNPINLFIFKKKA